MGRGPRGGVVGRPKLSEKPREVYSVRIEPTTAAYLKEVGGNSMGMGVDIVTEFYRQEMEKRKRVWLPFAERPKTSVLPIEEDSDAI